MEERNKKGKKMGAEMTDKAKGRATQKKSKCKREKYIKECIGDITKKVKKSYCITGK